MIKIGIVAKVKWRSKLGAMLTITRHTHREEKKNLLSDSMTKSIFWWFNTFSIYLYSFKQNRVIANKQFIISASEASDLCVPIYCFDHIRVICFGAIAGCFSTDDIFHCSLELVNSIEIARNTKSAKLLKSLRSFEGMKREKKKPGVWATWQTHTQTHAVRLNVGRKMQWSHTISCVLTPPSPKKKTTNHDENKKCHVIRYGKWVNWVVATFIEVILCE